MDQKQIPSFLRESNNQNDTIYFNKMLFIIRMNNFYRSQNIRFKEMQFMEEMFFYFNFNSALLTFYFTRSFLYSFTSCVYTTICFLTYGQLSSFYRALRFDSPQSIFARLHYQNKIDCNEFNELNNRFIQRYKLS